LCSAPPAHFVSTLPIFDGEGIPKSGAGLHLERKTYFAETRNASGFKPPQHLNLLLLQTMLFLITVIRNLSPSTYLG
jgi:hypothetical protein